MQVVTQLHEAEAELSKATQDHQKEMSHMSAELASLKVGLPYARTI